MKHRDQFKGIYPLSILIILFITRHRIIGQIFFFIIIIIIIKNTNTYYTPDASLILLAQQK